MLFGVQVPESQVIQLHLDLPDAQPVGQGRIYVQGFLGDTLPLFGSQGVQGLHVVKPVGQLDQHHADVLRHSHQHFPETFGVNGVLVVGEPQSAWLKIVEARVDPVQLGYAVHQGADFPPVAGLNILKGHAAVLDYVVKQSCDDGVGVEV